jgi:hypothetical protein
MSMCPSAAAVISGVLEYNPKIQSLILNLNPTLSQLKLLVAVSKQSYVESEVFLSERLTDKCEWRMLPMKS